MLLKHTTKSIIITQQRDKHNAVKTDHEVNERH